MCAIVIQSAPRLEWKVRSFDLSGDMEWEEHLKAKAITAESTSTLSIKRVLVLTASTLTSLSLIFRCMHAAVLFPSSLPCLAELTTHLHIANMTLAVLSLESLPRMHGLRRWNIKLNTISVDSNYLARRIMRVAPLLTHLRLSDVHDPELYLRYYATMLPESIRDLYVRPASDSRAFCYLVEQERAYRIHIEHPPPPSANIQADWIREARLAHCEWQQRCAGRRGCWIHPRMTYSKNLQGLTGRKSIKSAT